MDFILENVDGSIEVGELEKMAKAAGITQETLRNARAELKKQKRIRVSSVGFGPGKKWMIHVTPIL